MKKNIYLIMAVVFLILLATLIKIISIEQENKIIKENQKLSVIISHAADYEAQLKEEANIIQGKINLSESKKEIIKLQNSLDPINAKIREIQTAIDTKDTNKLLNY